MNDQSNENTKPPFFKNWKGLYAFVLIFEVILILAFILLTKYFAS